MAKKKDLIHHYYFTGLPVYDIIGKPLVAVAKAQAMMAREQIRTMLDCCFSFNGHEYEPIMLKMVVKRSVLEPSGTVGGLPELVEIVTHFYVPLITIFPLNSLGILNVDIDFEVEITSQFSNDDEDMSESTILDKLRKSKPQSPFHKVTSNDSKSELFGKIAQMKRSDGVESENHSDDHAVSTAFHINVEAGTLPLPKGMLEILDIYSKAIYADHAEGPHHGIKKKDW